MQTHFLYFALVILLVACNNTEVKNTSSSKVSQVKILQTISIPSDTLPYNFEYSSIFFEDSNLYFVGLDASTNALYEAV